jgi:hydroxyethylthiazole kinase-like uncharacterized protein yjeF
MIKYVFYMKIFSAEQLYEADKITTERQQISSLDLMERAGEQIFKWLEDKMKGAQVPIHIFCGIGNNGGDGLVVGRHLINHGYNVNIYIANFTDKRSKCFLINYDRIKDISKKWPVLMTSEADFPEINAQDIIIDALFGIGLNRPPEGWVKKLIEHINAQGAFKLSIDIPSGLHANEPIPDAKAVVKANHTLTFQAPKLAFFLPESGAFVPYFEVLDIGLDQQFLTESKPLAQTISKYEAQQFYKPRSKYDHKGTFGHALIVAGSYGKIGAAVLSVRAAFRIGAGLVTAFSPECGCTILQTAVPEAMVLSDDEDDFITNIKYDFKPAAVGIGMGIGTGKETIAALKGFFAEVKAPLVIDADALNCIAQHKELLKIIPKNSVLTPHPGELERLVGTWRNDFEKLEKARKFAKKHKVVLLIKGAHSVILFEESMYINTSGSPGMATAGSGDVLSGVITGLLAQGYDPLLATVFGVYLHGSAGTLASSRLSYEAVMASDISDYLGDAFMELFRQEQTSSQQS